MGSSSRADFLPEWMVVTDFDGTITRLDIGNELCAEVLGEKFHELYRRLRKNELGLKEYQKLMWQDFPLAENEFRKRARAYAELREGAEEFLLLCADSSIPVYVASCGLRPYIEEALDAKLSKRARAAIREIRCNEASFVEERLAHFVPPESSADCPYPLDKGAWCSELKVKFSRRVLGIGNGTSDRSFHGHVDRLAATEGLATWCEKSGVEFLKFETFAEVSNELKKLIAQGPRS